MYLAGVGAVGRVGRPGLSGNGARRPSFDVDFVGSGSLGAGAVFTRASVGTYYNSSGVLVSAAINTPRFDYDPVTLQLKGLLLEDASTNIAAYSGDISQVNWGKYGNVVAAPTVTANQATAPDGTLTASRVVYPAVTANPQSSVVYQAPVVTATQWTLSVWLRGNVGGEQLYLSMNAAGVFYSSPRLTLTTSWQRFSFTSPSPLTAVGWTWDIGTDFRDPTLASTPAQTVFIWGAQFEALPYMSSHIPTTSVSVTRAADFLSYPIASVTEFSQTQGSLVHDYIVEGAFSPSYNAPLQFVGADYNTDYIDADEQVYPYVAGVAISVAGAVTATVGYGNPPLPANVIHRGASSWALNNGIKGAHDGVAATLPSGTAATLPVITNLTISGYMHYQSKVSQWARRTRYWPRQLSQAELISATTLDGPTLSLDFMQPGSLDPRITFTRASSATYTDASGVVQTAATNAPRWDYAGGVLRGLLIEESRTNVFYPSTNWFASQPANAAQDGVIQNVGISPTGANNAMALIPGSTNTIHQAFIGFFGAVSTTYTYSVFCKAAGMRFIGIGLENNAFPGDQRPTFDLVNGTIHTQASNGSGKIQAVGNGWYRCSVTNTSDVDGGNYIMNHVPIASDGINMVFAGNNVDGIWVFGAQIEQGAFPTSYIPTTSVSVTRAADVATMLTNVSWYNSAAGTSNVEFQTNNPGASQGGILRIDDGTGNNVSTTFTGGTNVAVFGAIGGVVQINNGAVSNISTSSQKIANTMGGGVWRTCANGGAVNAGSGSASPFLATAMLFGNSIPGGASGWMINGYIRRVTYWNRALSDTEMQQVTT